jgi:hypothetical protein
LVRPARQGATRTWRQPPRGSDLKIAVLPSCGARFRPRADYHARGGCRRRGAGCGRHAPAWHAPGGRRGGRVSPFARRKANPFRTSAHRRNAITGRARNQLLHAVPSRRSAASRKRRPSRSVRRHSRAHRVVRVMGIGRRIQRLALRWPLLMPPVALRQVPKPKGQLYTKRHRGPGCRVAVVGRAGGRSRAAPLLTPLARACPIGPGCEEFPIARHGRATGRRGRYIFSRARRLVWRCRFRKYG